MPRGRNKARGARRPRVQAAEAGRDSPPTLIVTAILLVAFAIRVFRLGRDELWFDEAFAALVAFQPPPEIFGEIARDSSPPLYYLLLHIWAFVVGPEPGRAQDAFCPGRRRDRRHLPGAWPPVVGAHRRPDGGGFAGQFAASRLLQPRGPPVQSFCSVRAGLVPRARTSHGPQAPSRCRRHGGTGRCARSTLTITACSCSPRWHCGRGFDSCL